MFYYFARQSFIHSSEFVYALGNSAENSENYGCRI